MRTKNFRYNAFTLVELMIVIALLAMLAMIAIMSFQGQVSKGHDATRKADINRIKIAVEEYEKDHNCYPPPQLLTCKPGTGLVPYLSKIPCDPITNASYFYDYQPSTCPTWYRFYSKLEFAKDPVVVSGIGPNYAFNYVSGSPNMPDSTVGVPTVTAGPVGTSGGGGVVVGNPASKFYGCRSGSCVEIGWNSSRPGPECDPSYSQSGCFGACLDNYGNPNANTECKMVP